MARKIIKKKMTVKRTGRMKRNVQMMKMRRMKKVIIIERMNILYIYFKFVIIINNITKIFKKLEKISYLYYLISIYK
jgi:hypothetical protein